jgi:hypothetical protein
VVLSCDIPQIVAIVGTALVGSTPELCRYSDVAFCIGPPPNNTLQTNPSKSVQFPLDPKPVPEPLNPFMRFAATIAALPTSITIPHDIPLKVIVKVLTDARRSLLALKQCVFLAALGQAALAGIHVMNVWMGLPDVLPIHHTLWLLLFVVPLLSLSMLFCEPDVDGGCRGLILRITVLFSFLSSKQSVLRLSSVSQTCLNCAHLPSESRILIPSWRQTSLMMRSIRSQLCHPSLSHAVDRRLVITNLRWNPPANTTRS